MSYIGRHCVQTFVIGLSLLSGSPGSGQDTSGDNTKRTVIIDDECHKTIEVLRGKLGYKKLGQVVEYLVSHYKSEILAQYDAATQNAKNEAEMILGRDKE